ncbi:MAG: 1-acyl-sn-glycerol-3-phosphate acyltransferase, partial [Saprospiraceae bacterium]|nr:1-acyl-sn-glycerol-3-phosphate acyltransferase [Saprospiraceae bacterium]
MRHTTGLQGAPNLETSSGMDYRHVRKSNFIYNLFHPMLHPEYRIVFRKIYFHRKNIVPANKPVLIAANHPSAFIDPIFFCIFFNPPVFNMTRGDIFRKPFFRKMLESMNMFPVFRHRDGYDQRDRNDEVFEFCRKKLKEGVAVNIFVEGEHHLDKRILTIQKGLARVAFGAYEKDRDDELQIFPIGCNYFFGDAERDEAKIIVGDPLFVKDYWELYQQNQAAAITKLCNDIRAALIRICYHIEDKNDDRLANQLLLLRRSDNPDTMLPIVHHHADRFFEEKAMLNGLNTLPAGEKEALRSNVEAYLAALKQSGL